MKKYYADNHIKPKNLLLRNDETDTDVVIIDFGLAEHTGKTKLIYEKLYST